MCVETYPFNFCHSTDQPLRSLGLTITLKRAVSPQKTFSVPDIDINGLSVTQKITVSKKEPRVSFLLINYDVY